jgi:hypothetical protein
MSLPRTAVLIVIFVIGAAGLVSAARLFFRLLVHGRITWPAAPIRHMARSPAGGRRSPRLRAAVSRPRTRRQRADAPPTPDRRDPISGPPP